MANDISTSFDKEMLLIDPDWGKDVTSAVAMRRRLISQLGGVKTISQVIPDTPLSANCEYTLSDREGIYNLIQFFNDRKSRTKSFWFLHPSRAFTLKEPYSSGNTYIKAERNYGELWTQGLSSQYDWGIYIKMHNDDLICRKVTGVTDEGDMTRVYLDETIPRNITNDNHYIIGRTLVGRFDQNELSVDFSAQGIGKSTLKFTENYREYDAWVPIEGIRNWHVGQCSNTLADHSFGRVQIKDGPLGELRTAESYINMGYDSIYYYYPYIRFTDINIPQYSGIITCYMRWYIWTEHAPKNGVEQLCFGAVDDAYQVTTYSVLYNYPRTSYTNWNWYASDDWNEDTWHYTPNINASLQEVVDRPGYEGGNNIIMLHRHQSGYGSYRAFQRQTYRPYIEIVWI